MRGMSGQRAAASTVCASLADRFVGRLLLFVCLRPPRSSSHSDRIHSRIRTNLSLTHTQPTAKMSSTAEEDRIKRVQVRTTEGRQKQQRQTIRLRPSLTAALPPLYSSVAHPPFLLTTETSR